MSPWLAFGIGFAVGGVTVPLVIFFFMLGESFGR